MNPRNKEQPISEAHERGRAACLQAADEQPANKTVLSLPEAAAAQHLQCCGNIKPTLLLLHHLQKLTLLLLHPHTNLLLHLSPCMYLLFLHSAFCAMLGSSTKNILLNENHQQNAQNNGQDSIVLSMMIVWVSALLSSVPGKGSKGSSRLPSEQHKMANRSHSNVHPPLPAVIIPKEIETANEPLLPPATSFLRLLLLGLFLP
jgi:hypothetical protein